MTTGSILGRLIPFALPVIAGNLLQELYNVVDTLIVGKILGVDKLAAVGATGSLCFLVLGFVMGLTSGCAVISSQRFGAGDEEGLRKSVAANLSIGIITTVIFTVVFVSCAGWLLTLLNTPVEAYQYAKQYITVIFAGMFASFLYNVLASSLRAVGDSKTPLLLLVCSSLLNIALDVLFIVAFKWDVAGAAFATVLAQLLSGVGCAIYIVKKTPLIIPTRESWRGLWQMVRNELKIAIPMGFQGSFIALGMMVLQYVLNGFGVAAVAAYTVGGKVQSLCQNPMISMNTAVATFVGQNAGAKKHDRLKAGVKKCLVVTLGLSIIVGAVVWLLAKPITLLFVNPAEVEVIALVKVYLNWGCPLLWTLSFLFIYRGALQGLGDGVVPMLGGVFELVMRAAIPLIFGKSLGFTSICVAGPAAWAACGLLMTVAYFVRSGKLIQKEL